MSIYLDHNATTPLDPEVLSEMLPYLQDAFGNPSSAHGFGQRARRGLDLARERVASLIGAEPQDIVFTSGGTESDNHAIKGAFRARQRYGKHMVTTAIEHQAVLAACQDLKVAGARVTHVGVDRFGAVDPEAAREAMTDDTALVSVMAANNDVGTIQPVALIARAARERGIPVHCDAVQAVGKIGIDVQELGADLVSFSSHKIYGPKGAGALYIRPGTRVAPLIHGGHHESRRRAGTENVPAIVGFGKACELAAQRLQEDAARIGELRNRLQAGLVDNIENMSINGHPEHRLPGTLSASFRGIEGETLVMALDLEGIAVSTGSACSSDSRDPSHVLVAMGCPFDVIRGSIRFSLGRGNTMEEVESTIEAVARIVKRLRDASPG